MFKKSLIAAAGAIAILSLVIVGCSSDKAPEQGSVVNRVVGEITDTVVDNVIDAQFAANQVELDNYTENRFGGIADVLVEDSVIYAAFECGLIVYNLTDSAHRAFDAGEQLNALAVHDGHIYVGGTNLFVFENGALRTAGRYFDKPITAMQSYDGKLMIGTGDGLYAKAGREYELVRENIPVSALTADESGLWVGTDGAGLFRMEGESFKKRYLLRDTSIFDDVNCLDYSRGYVYAGTDDALYIFDGGKWDTWTVANGLPSNVIRDIDAAGWMVYIATDNGVTGMFDNNLYPARSLENKIVNVIQRIDNKVIAGTDRDGLLMKSGASLMTLVEPGDLGDTYVEAGDIEPADAVVEVEEMESADPADEIIAVEQFDSSDEIVEAVIFDADSEMPEPVEMIEAEETSAPVETDDISEQIEENETNEVAEELNESESKSGEGVETLTVFDE